MAVKFGPGGYSSATLRRFIRHLPPDPKDVEQGHAQRARRIRAVALLVGILIVLVVGGGAGTGYLFPPSPTALGTVVMKERIDRSDGQTPILGLQVRLEDGATQDVVLECDDSVWSQFDEGDPIQVRYKIRAEGIEVTSIEPAPAPVEF